LLFLRVREIHPSAWLFVGLSALLQVLIFPLPNLYFLSWIAFAPLIFAILRTRSAGALEINGSPNLQAATPGQAFLLAYVCGILWYAGTCYWIYDTMHEHGGLSAITALLVLILFCLYLGLYHGLFGLLVGMAAAPGRDHRRALISVPFFWVASELARTRITGFPWDLLGTAQIDNISLSRVSTVTGVYGLSFEIMLVNLAFAAAFLVPRKKRSALLLAAAGAAVVLQAGRLVEPPAVATDHVALLVQQNIPVDQNWTRGTFTRTLDELTSLTVKAANSNGSARRAGESKPELIVWPESPAPFFTNDPLFRNPVSEMASATKTWVVTGAIGVRPARKAPSATEVFNSAALVNPAGEWATRYDKVHLVPFGEYLPFPKLFAFAGGLTKEVGEFKAGESRTPLRAGDESVGVFICYESVFPDEVRQFANSGAQLFVNISNDGWYGDSGAYAQHLNQTRMRAVENDRWILSTADTGVTASIDPYGRIVAQLPRKVRDALAAPYALNSGLTFYSRHGDWFAYLCAIISLGALLTRFAPLHKDTKKESA
jgi:apolipoprotein N-acyltransferase